MVVEENKRYITIAEYCEYMEVSKQAVYQKLNKALKQYVVEIDGQKHIDSVIFTEYHHKDKDPTEEVKDIQDNSSQEVNESQGASMGFNSHSQDNSSQEVNGIQDNSSPTVNESQGASSDFFKFLQRQLEEKDKQIALLQQQNAELQQSNKEKDSHIIEQSAKITMLLEHSQELQRNSQYLLAQANNNEQGNNTEPVEETKKKGLFSRLFKK
ncbi:MAG: hypothetical protein IJB98_03235 [Clostridia bacterium]|nr:hypothetical protein [Clostridia bacterium]